jgi:mRNA interferase RelE/StbE
VVIRADFSPRPDAAPLPAGFEDIADVVAEAERDPGRRAALEAGRRTVAERHYAGATSLAALRLRRGWSQRTLAENSGLRQPHIARLESGRNDPSLATMRRLAQALGVTLSEMVEALDAPERPAS